MKFDKDSNGRNRFDRMIYYFGDILQINSKTAMKKKMKELNRLAKANDEIERKVRNEILKIQRRQKKDKDRNYIPKHAGCDNESGIGANV